MVAPNAPSSEKPEKTAVCCKTGKGVNQSSAYPETVISRLTEKAGNTCFIAGFARHGENIDEVSQCSGKSTSIPIRLVPITSVRA